MSILSYLFEDHCESYIHWKEAGLKNLCAVHIDAHLDVADEGLTTKVLNQLKACKSTEELEKFRKNEDILWGGFHPGNYLYPAIFDGTITRLIWVIPEHLPGENDLLSWARQELMEWVDLSLSDYDSLRHKQKRVVGKLMGCDFDICFLDNLPPLEGDYVWDIDTDYLIDKEDIPFISPMEMIDKLRRKAPDPKMITIAYSVNGGYLPPEQKYLGDLTLKSINNEITPELRELYDILISGDRAFESEDYNMAESRFRNISGESLLEPYINLRMASIAGKRGETETETEKSLMEEVKKLNHSLILPPYDTAMIHFRRKNYPEALSILEKTAHIDETHFMMSHFITAVIHIKKREFEKSGLHWNKIIESEYFGNWNTSIRAHINYLTGSTLLRAKKFKEAIDFLSRSIKLNPGNHRAFSLRGQALLDLGDYRRAARDFRKFLWLKPDIIESLEVHLLLAETYKQQNKKGMEKMEIRNVLRKDTTGTYSIKARLGRYR